MGLDTVELVMRVEKEFGIEIPDADAVQMHTVGDMNQFIAEQVAARASRPGLPVAAQPLATWERLVPLIVEELGVEPEQVTPSAQWRRDLRAS